MANNLPDLLVIPDGNPFKRLMLRKCLPRVKVFHQNFGAELFVHDVIDSFYPSKFDNSRYSDIKPGDLATIMEAYRLFFTQCVNLELTKEQVKKKIQVIISDLKNCGIVDDAIIELIVISFFGRSDELKLKFSNDAIKLNKNYLVDFDWKVNLSLSGDVIAQCRQPIMLLLLKYASNAPTSNDENSQLENEHEVVLELTLDELEGVINNLEGVNTFLNKLQY